MGLVIDADENDQKVTVEIRRESVRISSGLTGSREEIFQYSDSIEIDKDYLRRIVEFFNQHPEHLKYI
jgi:hypothetical protein